MSSIGVGAGGAAAAEEEPEPEDAAAVAAAAVEEAAAEEAATARRRREGAAIYLFVSILFRSMSSEQTRARPGSLRERAKEKEKEKEKKRGGGVKRPRGVEVEGKARVVFLCSSSKKNQWRFRHS
jgi:hypothetical protein